MFSYRYHQFTTHIFTTGQTTGRIDIVNKDEIKANFYEENILISIKILKFLS